MTGDNRPVLVVTELDDETADAVITELYRRGVPVVRFDAADFPRQLTLAAHVGNGRGLHGWLRTPTRKAELSQARALYYRRPSGFAFPGLDEQDARFAVAQARYGLGGVLASLPSCRYVNHPHAIADCEFKPTQLAAAVAAGFDVPATLITNDPTEARAFAQAHGPVVYKALRATRYESDGEPRTVWTQGVTAEEIDDSVAGTAHLFQALVDKTGDLRAIVVGERVFCVRIDCEPPLLDWRFDYARHTYAAVEPPDGLVQGCHTFLKGLGLLWGCFDFALRADDGAPVFLECNANGQWLWLAEHLGLPIAAAFAEVLEGARP